MLADRFRLQLHQETRDLTVYALVRGGRVVTLRRSEADAFGMPKLPGRGLRLEFRKTSIAELAAFLSTLAAVDRPVRDATGLDGAYDFSTNSTAPTAPPS